MNTTHSPNLPDVPPGATAGEWNSISTASGLPTRPLTWSRHDTEKVGVSVDGWQFADGGIKPEVSLYGSDEEGLTAAQARALARNLIAAADKLDSLSLNEIP